jgi:hypothetical protein
MTHIEPSVNGSEGPKRSSPLLSTAACKVLARLKRGPAYRVGNAWRFRGVRTPAAGATIDMLLVKGLAERFDTDTYSGVRITPAGRLLAHGAAEYGRP